jgi:hypothetical protein
MKVDPDIDHWPDWVFDPGRPSLPVIEGATLNYRLKPLLYECSRQNNRDFALLVANAVRHLNVYGEHAMHVVRGGREAVIAVSRLLAPRHGFSVAAA